MQYTKMVFLNLEPVSLKEHEKVKLDINLDEGLFTREKFNLPRL